MWNIFFQQLVGIWGRFNNPIYSNSCWDFVGSARANISTYCQHLLETQNCSQHQANIDRWEPRNTLKIAPRVMAFRKFSSYLALWANTYWLASVSAFFHPFQTVKIWNRDRFDQHFNSYWARRSSNMSIYCPTVAGKVINIQHQQLLEGQSTFLHILILQGGVLLSSREVAP